MPIFMPDQDDAFTVTDIPIQVEPGGKTKLLVMCEAIKA
jgi:hypothetical protein